MKIISKNQEWFSGNEGQQHFEKCKDLAERSMFIYSYLKAICDENKTKYDHTPLFKIAFLLADAVFTSELSYAKLPDFLDVQKNPFLAYVKNTPAIIDEEIVYASLLSILHSIANPFSKKEWIFGEEITGKEDLILRQSKLKFKLIELEHQFEYSPLTLVNPEDYKIESDKEFIQLEIIWLMGNLSFEEFSSKEN